MINQTPWIERKFDFNFPIGLFPVIIQRLLSTIPALTDLVKEHSDEKLSERKNGKWSAKEIIGHLSDVEELWNGRIDDFLSGAQTLRAADMTNARTTAANHNNKSVSELIDQFKKARIQLINKVKDYDETTACLNALHPRLKTPMRLIDSLFFVAEHDDHEMTKIMLLIHK